MSGALRWNRLFAWAALLPAFAWILIANLNWTGLHNGLRASTPWRAVDGQSLLFSGAVQAPVVLASLGLHLCATVIGYALVVRPLFGAQRPASTPWLVAAGFMPGYLLVIPVSRLTTLLLPNSIAPWVVWSVLLAATAAALGLILSRRRAPLAFPVSWTPLAQLAGAFLAALVFGVLIDRMHVMGSASHDFTRDLYLTGQFAIGQAGHFPLISQHYDEPAYLYPVVFGFLQPGPTADGTMTLAYWLFLAQARVALAALIYVSIRVLGVDRLSALLTTLFVWAASLTLNPLATNILFDSLSPLGQALHPSRVLAPAAPLVFLAAAASLKGRLNPGGLIIALLIGAGLSAMTVSISLVVVWGVGVILLTALLPAAARGQALWRGLAVACLVCLAAASVAYGLQGIGAAPRAVVMLAASVAGGGALMAVLLAIRRKGDDPERLRPTKGLAALFTSLGPAAPYYFVLAAGFAIGFALFGNVLVYAFLKYLSPLMPWQDVGVWNRVHGSFSAQPATIMQSPFCVVGEAWTGRILSRHCGSLPAFARTYGLGFVLISLVSGWWLVRRPTSPRADHRTLTMLFWGLALCLLAQPIAFVLYDFEFSPGIDANWSRHLSVWAKARLVESWFYGGILIALVLFFSTAGDRERRWGQTALMVLTAVYLFNPMIAPAQFSTNAAYLAQALFSR